MKQLKLQLTHMVEISNSKELVFFNIFNFKIKNNKEDMKIEWELMEK